MAPKPHGEDGEPGSNPIRACPRPSPHGRSPPVPWNARVRTARERSNGGPGLTSSGRILALQASRVFLRVSPVERWGVWRPQLSRRGIRGAGNNSGEWGPWESREPLLVWIKTTPLATRRAFNVFRSQRTRFGAELLVFSADR